MRPGVQTTCLMCVSVASLPSLLGLVMSPPPQQPDQSRGHQAMDFSTTALVGNENYDGGGEGGEGGRGAALKRPKGKQKERGWSCSAPNRQSGQGAGGGRVMREGLEVVAPREEGQSPRDGAAVQARSPFSGFGTWVFDHLPLCPSAAQGPRGVSGWKFGVSGKASLQESGNWRTATPLKSFEKSLVSRSFHHGAAETYHHQDP